MMELLILNNITFNISNNNDIFSQLLGLHLAHDDLFLLQVDDYNTEMS